MLTKHQQYVANSILEAFEKENIAYLGGSAGTGKSYTAIEIANTYDGDMVLSATTNKAAEVLKSLTTTRYKTSTVHSFLGLRLEWSEGKHKLVQDSSRYNETDLLVVDEASMINAELYTHIQRALFGGQLKNILFVGDPYQLPPVNGRGLEELEKSPYFLEEIVRQEQNNPIIQEATIIRELIKNSTDLLHTFKTSTDSLRITQNHKEWQKEYLDDGEEKIILAFQNVVVDRHNKNIRDILKPNAKELEEGDHLIAQEVFERDGTIIITNGERLSVKEIEDGDEFWIVKDLEDRVFRVVKQAYKQEIRERLGYLYKKRQWLEYIKLKSSFLDVKYPYASTIHKAQGSTWSSVYIDLRYLGNKIDTVMKNRLIYVAITRASSRVMILH